MLQPLQEGLQGEHFQSGRSQFNGKRQAIDTPANLDDEGKITGGKCTVGNHLSCPLDKQGHCSITDKRLPLKKSCRSGQGERLDDILAFASHAQPLSARHQQFQTRTASQQVYQEWCCIHHLLEVVKYEQQVLPIESHFHLLEGWSRSALLKAKRPCNGGKDKCRIVQGGQRDKADPIGEALLHLVGDRESQTSLAHPPVPVSVSKRVVGRRSKVHASATSCSLPINEVRGYGSVEGTRNRRSSCCAAPSATNSSASGVVPNSSHSFSRK